MSMTIGSLSVWGSFFATAAPPVLVALIPRYFLDGGGAVKTLAANPLPSLSPAPLSPPLSSSISPLSPSSMFTRQPPPPGRLTPQPLLQPRLRVWEAGFSRWGGRAGEGREASGGRDLLFWRRRGQRHLLHCTSTSSLRPLRRGGEDGSPILPANLR